MGICTIISGNQVSIKSMFEIITTSEGISLKMGCLSRCSNKRDQKGYPMI